MNREKEALTAVLQKIHVSNMRLLCLWLSFDISMWSILKLEADI